ncbi:MAG: PDZ domain-containing protein, partial [Gammaproteobacteria bacterium]|nr:PDZ domain-containing protein [Gammaproteobacteria bacterium]
RKIQNSDEARNVIGLLRSGQDVHVFFIRNGKKQKVIAQATSIERVKAKGEEISAILAGSTLSAVKPDSPFAVINMGIEVERVSENSNAWLAGLRKGDIIIAANRTTVNQLSELRDAIKQNEIRLLLNIVRNGEAILLLVQ